MNKKDLYNYFLWILILFVLILEIINLISIPNIPKILEDDEIYKYGWICSEYKFKSAEDAGRGWNCILEQCKIVSDNPRTEECVCVLNNLTVNKICTRQLYLREYPFPTYNKPQQINVSKEKYDEIVNSNQSGGEK